MQQFVIYGRPIVIGRMESLAVVKALNIFKYRLSSLSPGLTALMMHRLGFKVWKKLSETLLAQQLPLRLMLCLMPCRANSARRLSEAY
jgi:hypothetical protein